MRAISVPTLDEIESARRMIRESWGERERAMRSRMSTMRQERLAERLRDGDNPSGRLERRMRRAE